MSPIDRFGQIIDEKNAHFQSNQKKSEANVFSVDEETSKRLASIINSLGLNPTVIAVGCNRPLETEGIDAYYYDSYDSVGRPDRSISGLDSSGQTIYIDGDYDSELTLPRESQIITDNDRRREFAVGRSLIAVVVGDEIITDDERLRPYKVEITKPPEQVESEEMRRRIAFRQKLLGEEPEAVEPDVTKGVICVFGKAEK